ncbi:hypothetical protein RB599_002059 [Gaeumannomyces hyphopodioides]
MSPGRHDGDELAHEIRDLPGRGKGVVAVRKIRAWEVIMDQSPAMVMQMDLWRRARVQGPLEDILRTNVFGLDPNGVLHMGLFVVASSINHNRRPK